MRFILLIFIANLSLCNQLGDQKKCYETILIPKQYKTITKAVHSDSPPPRKVIIPTEYRIDTSFVEVVPTGTAPPAHIPKQYKKVLHAVALPCVYQTDEDGNCYTLEVVPESRETITEEVEIPCAYKKTPEGNCERKMEVLCMENINSSVRKRIQNSLREKGYEAGKGKTAFTTTTAKALEAFQIDNELLEVPWSMESLEVLGLIF